MRRILLFVLPILIVIAAAFTVFGIIQIRFEKERLFDDLHRKTVQISEGMELSVRNVLLNNDLKSANYLVRKFEKRERLQGCVIYDKEGKIIAITERFSDWKAQDKPHIKDALDKKDYISGLIKFKEYTVYSFVLPITDEQNRVLGLMEIIHDTSYVFTRLTELWRRISIALVVLVVFILIISTLLYRQIFTLPVQRLTEWFKHFQKGETDKMHKIKTTGDLGKLASEVEQVALSLRIARKTVSDVAAKRIEQEEIWTETKLRDLTHAKLGDNALVVVSNREPYMHVVDEATGETKCIRPASGLVTAIHPILSACGGTWIAHGGGNADKKFVNSKDKLGVPPEDNRYILKRVWLSKEEEEGYYYGFANEGLWPLCHNTHTRPIFRESDWNMYKKVNQKFADSVVEELPAKNPFVFVQDYHFTLLPKMIKEKRPDATVALFWHIPWPNPENFLICPYQTEILEGMLGCDLIGFHVQNHCNNFLDTANRLLESRVDTEKFSVVRFGKETFVRSFPISVNGHTTGVKPKVDTGKLEKIKREFDLKDKIIGLGVERIDYTKGITERILAIDRFLEKYPEYKNKFVFIQIGAPSRTHLKRYHDLMSEIDELIEKKNWKHRDGSWRPIIYFDKHFSPEEIEPLYALADFCIVSSLDDGMNLVAKEYVASKEDLNGILILSQFTGAARELTDAILINPYAIEDFAEAIKLAIEMPQEEKIKRMGNMRKIVAGNNIYRWAANIITEMASLKKT